MLEEKTFEVKIAYFGYQVFQVKAHTEDEAYQKAEEDAGLGLFDLDEGHERDPEILEPFLDTMHRYPEEDTVDEVDGFTPPNEDLVLFGPLTLPGCKQGPMFLDPNDSLKLMLDRVAGGEKKGEVT